MTAAPADRSTARLSEVARHVVIPEGIVDSLWFDLEPRLTEFGDRFDRWQDGLAQLALGLRDDGLFAASVGGVLLSIPRQVAKTFVVGRLCVLLATAFPGLTVLWTAHRTRTTTRTFESLHGFVQREAVRPYLRPDRSDGIRTSHGEQEIRFANESAILFGAREQGFGRGFDEIDVEVFDEAQILTESALEDMVPATNQSRFWHGALLFLIGTPPRPKDPGEEFASRRRDALAGKPDGQVVAEHGDALYVECSADPDVGRPDGPSLMDRAQWAKGNPSYPHHTPEVSMLRMRRNLTNDDSWRREALGVWDGDVLPLWQVIGKQQWAGLAIAAEAAPPDGQIVYGVKFSADGERVSCGVALRPDDGPVHVESLGVAPMSAGTAALAEWLSEPARWRSAAAIVVDGKAGAGDLVQRLTSTGVPARRVRAVTTDEAITAHAGLLQAVRDGGLTHLAQKGLTRQVKVAGKRRIGSAGGWGWEPVTPDGDVTALDAVTLAHGAALRAHSRDNSRSSGRKAVVM